MTSSTGRPLTPPVWLIIFTRSLAAFTSGSPRKLPYPVMEPMKPIFSGSAAPDVAGRPAIISTATAVRIASFLMGLLPSRPRRQEDDENDFIESALDHGVRTSVKVGTPARRCFGIARNAAWPARGAA